MGKTRKHIVHIVGARPNFMKMAPLWHALSTKSWARQTVIHTGQHFTPVMSEEIIRDLDLPAPDINLGINSGSFLEQIAVTVEGLVKRFSRLCPDVVIVYGDVNSTLAGAIAAKRSNIRLVHVEAGLRSRDLAMPEERNRVLTDHLADILLAPSEDGRKNLLAEGVASGSIRVVGNIMVDSLHRAREKAKRTKFSPAVLGLASSRRQFALLTLHRPANVDSKKNFTKLFDILVEASKDLPIIFPVHPRTALLLKKFRLMKKTKKFSGTLARSGIYTLPPLAYLEFIHLYGSVKMVLTDSGGIQEETSVLGVPCLTLRENTERPITVTHGTNTVVGSSQQAILSGIRDIMRGRYKKPKHIPLWDGRASVRIVRALKTTLYT